MCRSAKAGWCEVMAGRIDFYFIPLAAAASALNSDKLDDPGRELAEARAAHCPTCRRSSKPAIRAQCSASGTDYRRRQRRRPTSCKKLHDVTERR